MAPPTVDIAAGGVATPVVPWDTARRFAILLVQLLVLLAAFQGPLFIPMAIVVGGFCVHFWLPARMKEPLWLALSVGAVIGLSGIQIAAAIAGILLCIYLICTVPLSLPLRYAAAIGLAAGVLAIGHSSLGASIVFRMFAGFSLLRILVYIYEAQFFESRPPVRDFLRYWLILPSFFLPFPMLRYDVLNGSTDRRPQHAVAQQGIYWMALAVVQLAVTNFISARYGSQFVPFVSPGPTSALGVALLVGYHFLMFLQAVACYHICAGVLHLFGYDVPLTNRNVALAQSPLDMWRRQNIYWKDSMMRAVYMPLYFKWRRAGDLRAKVLAMLAVVVVSWLMHLWLLAWKRESVGGLWQPMENVHWLIFGAATLANLVWVETVGEDVPVADAPRASSVGWRLQRVWSS